MLFFFLLIRPLPISTLFPYTTLFRSASTRTSQHPQAPVDSHRGVQSEPDLPLFAGSRHSPGAEKSEDRSEEHTSELQSHSDLVCRLLLEKKKITRKNRQENQSGHNHN